jgi:hypothetical protein
MAWAFYVAAVLLGPERRMLNLLSFALFLFRFGLVTCTFKHRD